MRQMPLYSNIYGRKIVYWLSQIGVRSPLPPLLMIVHRTCLADKIRQFGAGPLILTWVNEICSDDTEKRSLLIALGNDLAYVVQAVAPNFVWKTTDFPAAKKGYLWSIILQILLSEYSAFDIKRERGRC